MKFVDNTNPSDERKLSKCSDPNCDYLGSIMRESEDGRRWCAIHVPEPPPVELPCTCQKCGAEIPELAAYFKDENGLIICYSCKRGAWDATRRVTR